MELCNITNIPKDVEFFQTLGCGINKACLCPVSSKSNEEYFFLNEHGVPDSAFSNLNIKFCLDQDDNSNCLQNSFSSLLGNLYFIDSYIDSLNYTNPVQFYLNKINVPINNNIVQRQFVSFTKDYYISDNGWILEDFNEIEFYKYKETYTYYSIGGNRYSVSVVFEAPRLRDKINRSYMKIQELFAKVGGLINALLITSKVLLFHYYKWMYYLTLSEPSIQDNSEKINNNNSSIHPISLI